MQQFVIVLVVAVAALYALWHFMPARWRLALARRLGLGARAAQAGSCHACDDCGACAAPPQESDEKRPRSPPVKPEQLLKK